MTVEKMSVRTALTAAETRVVLAMRYATTEAECARRLGLSIHTVHMHLRNARAKRHVQTTRQLVLGYAREIARTGVAARS